MNTITLRKLLPEVFADERDSHANGNVWLTELTFRRGQRYMLHAESGAGKSSLCAFIYGLRTDYSGELIFDSTPVSTLSPANWSEIRTRHLAFVPQNLSLFPEMTVIENIMLKNRMTDCRTDGEITQMLQTAGIADKRNTPAALLSLGQQQRVAIIRALCQPMDFLILDEPVSHLDEANNLIMAQMIDSALRQNGAGLIATSVGNPLLITPITPLTL
ncbi:MAG: ATP-binding cassette domain-containing protein [Muribaculaceae bacterium]|nr:ATP-binding cassette domain-containing protein [Muribaculaceae bacterium]